MEQSKEWVLPLRDGTVIKIPANKVAGVIKKIDAKQPIHVADRVVLYQDIASGPQEYTPPPLDPELQIAAALAFGDPVINALGEVTCVWIKETVSAERWNKYYSQFACYYRLGNSYDSVVIAYRIPVHYAQMVGTSVEKCNPIEIQQLETKLANS